MVRQYEDIIVTDGPSADEVLNAWYYDKTMRKTLSFTGYESDAGPESFFHFEATILELSEAPGGDPSVFHVTLLDVSLKGKYKGIYNARTCRATLTPA